MYNRPGADPAEIFERIVEEHHNHVLITHATRRAVYKTTADLGGD
jgi:hypothetical protein